MDDGKGLTVRCVLDDREVERGRRRRTGEIENHNLVFCIIGFYVLSGFFKKSIFFKIMLTWKIVGASKDSVIYIYIYIYRLNKEEKKMFFLFQKQ